MLSHYVFFSKHAFSGFLPFALLQGVVDLGALVFTPMKPDLADFFPRTEVRTPTAVFGSAAL
jgi:hypothetical protein